MYPTFPSFDLDTAYAVVGSVAPLVVLGVALVAGGVLGWIGIKLGSKALSVIIAKNARPLPPGGQ